LVSALHADVSSAAAEIYAASVALSRLLYMSYVCDEMGQEFEMPIEIGVDNATAITFASGTVKKSTVPFLKKDTLPFTGATFPAPAG
jgi:hypothetical protein